MTIQSAETVARSRLQSMSDIVSNVEVVDASSVEVTLTVSEDLEPAAASTVLNQSVVLAVSRLSELQEDSLMYKLSEVKLRPMERSSVVMFVQFSIGA